MSQSPSEKSIDEKSEPEEPLEDQMENDLDAQLDDTLADLDLLDQELDFVDSLLEGTFFHNLETINNPEPIIPKEIENPFMNTCSQDYVLTKLFVIFNSVKISTPMILIHFLSVNSKRRVVVVKRVPKRFSLYLTVFSFLI